MVRTLIHFLEALNWPRIIEDALANLIPSALLALTAYLLSNQIYRKIKISQKLASYGFETVGTKNQTRHEVEKMCQNSDLIKMIYVSGQGYLNSNKRELMAAMEKGTEIRFLCARPRNEFLYSIERLEKKKGIRKASTQITDEIEAIIKQYQSYIERDLFKIRFYSSGYRLPFILAYDKHSDRTNAWLTMTLPPYKSQKNFVLRGKREDDEYEQPINFISMMEEHFDSLWEVGSISLQDLKKGEIHYFGKENYLFWKKQYEQAKDQMKMTIQNPSALIEVAAQHPLIDGKFPNEEFEKRLNKACELYYELKRTKQVVKIYVPGSRHLHEGCADDISLSSAGRSYLVNKGISEADILADDMNQKYKGNEGVYNTPDECYVASKIYLDHEFGELHCVCSPAQMMRKVISYIGFGVLPDIHTVSLSNMYHDYIDECTIHLPNLLNDNSLMQEQSFLATSIRDSRRPNSFD